MSTYNLISHSDETQTFVIESKGHSITLNYPEDITSFSEFTQENLDLHVSGFISNLTDYVEHTGPIESVKLSGFI
jgi:hypothetical protein